MAGNEIEDKLKEITRHVISHDQFDEIYIEHYREKDKTGETK